MTTAVSQGSSPLPELQQQLAVLELLTRQRCLEHEWQLLQLRAQAKEEFLQRLKHEFSSLTSPSASNTMATGAESSLPLPPSTQRHDGPPPHYRSSVATKPPPLTGAPFSLPPPAPPRSPSTASASTPPLPPPASTALKADDLPVKRQKTDDALPTPPSTPTPVTAAPPKMTRSVFLMEVPAAQADVLHGALCYPRDMPVANRLANALNRTSQVWLAMSMAGSQQFQGVAELLSGQVVKTSRGLALPIRWLAKGALPFAQAQTVIGGTFDVILRMMKEHQVFPVRDICGEQLRSLLDAQGSHPTVPQPPLPTSQPKASVPMQFPAHSPKVQPESLPPPPPHRQQQAELPLPPPAVPPPSIPPPATSTLGSALSTTSPVQKDPSPSWPVQPNPSEPVHSILGAQSKDQRHLHDNEDRDWRHRSDRRKSPSDSVRSADRKDKKRPPPMSSRRSRSRSSSRSRSRSHRSSEPRHVIPEPSHVVSEPSRAVSNSSHAAPETPLPVWGQSAELSDPTSAVEFAWHFWRQQAGLEEARTAAGDQRQSRSRSASTELPEWPTDDDGNVSSW